MAVSQVTLRHPVTGDTWLCPAGAVDAWRAKGWEPADETTSTPGDGGEATPVDGDSDPAHKGRNPKGSK